MGTQKTVLAVIRDYAADLGAIISVRKNAYGEYDARVRMIGKREYVLSYFADSFQDACNTVIAVLDKIKAEQKAEGDRRVAQYAIELQQMIDHSQAILNLVGCRLEVDAQDTVTFYSPSTGSHSLAMRFGVRPVSDLLVHAVGFAQNQRTGPVEEARNALVAGLASGNVKKFSF